MKIPPALILFFLAPAIAELLSGSAPPSEFFNPIIFIILASLYGSGALIIRELKIRWNKSYVTTFILGAAYGILEEGLMVKSFFDPNWMDLGILGRYGRWLGVNWVWAEWLTIYHAIYSIAIPITLAELAYIERRNESWIGNKTLALLTILLGAVTLLGHLYLTPYKPAPIHIIITAITILSLIIIAWKIPPKTGKTGKQQPPNPTKLAIAGYMISAGLFTLFMAGPHIIPQPPLIIILGTILITATNKLLNQYKWSEKTLYQKYALTAGAIAFLITLTPIQELDKNRPDNPQGMLIVGITAAILLLLLKRKIKQKLIAHHFTHKNTKLSHPSSNSNIESRADN